MKKNQSIIGLGVATTLLALSYSSSTLAEGLPDHSKLQEALKAVVAEDNGGFGLNMWAAVVDRDGVVQTVVFSGEVGLVTILM